MTCLHKANTFGRSKPDRTKLRNPILLLEDEPFIALDLEGLLDENGYDVVCLTTSAEALAWLDAHTPLMAIIDPRLSDGICSAVVRRLADREVPFVVYSGEPASIVDEEPAFGLGKHLSKPATPESVIAAVRRALDEPQA
jgi:DNA-binding NtrC family response regulator